MPQETYDVYTRLCACWFMMELKVAGVINLKFKQRGCHYCVVMFYYICYLKNALGVFCNNHYMTEVTV